MEAFAQGNALFVDEDFEGALRAYNQALVEEPSNVEYLVKRSTALFKLKRFVEAAEDAEKAVVYSRGESSAALFRHGSALFYLDKFREAKEVFLKAQNLLHPQAAMWVRKCDAELSERNEGEVSEEGPSDSSTARETEEKIETPKLADRMKFAWIQTPTSVSITYYVKNLTSEQVEVNFLQNRLEIKISLPDSSVYSSAMNLFADIDTSKSTVKTNAYKVIVDLKKSVVGDWDDLYAKDQGQVVKRENIRGRFEGPSYPSSSLKKKDWTAMEKEAVKEDEAEKPAGDDALNKLFKDIYSKADEDTRRAMIKSFQTSGGTVLSTNWKEVSKTNYEESISAPKGMEVHKWNEK